MILFQVRRDCLKESLLDYSDQLVFNDEVMVSVAQLVEPRIVIPVVVGSSPIVHPIITIPFFLQAFFVCVLLL